MSDILRLCETEAQAISANLGFLLSPEVSSSTMWFLRRFCLTYLLPNESFYAEVILSFCEAFERKLPQGFLNDNPCLCLWFF